MLQAHCYGLDCACDGQAERPVRLCVVSIAVTLKCMASEDIIDVLRVNDERSSTQNRVLRQWRRWATDDEHERFEFCRTGVPGTTLKLDR